MKLESLLHDISYSSEVIAYLTTIVFYSKHKNRVSFLLLLLMSIIAITETMGKFKSWFPGYTHIFLVQNIEMLLEVFIFLLVYYYSVITTFLRRWILLMIVIYSCFALFCCFTVQPPKDTFPTYSIVVGGLFLLISILIFFYEGLNNFKPVSFYRNYLFYISVGLFIFYANEIPVMTLLNYFLENNTAIEKVFFVINLKLVVSIIFYGLYSFGIIWTTRK